ncbi:transglutaminase-like putative cysteine protease [Erwinia toletana]|uniref:Transglutaminase-like putative cysteine protease n=1 Tax=Winslowiella toletana TaxID=92490 RepID=A0ABS4P827_9GAMM|nr:transglutaminase family protein [Winslowiella toletana]MBP2168250.1 transglutaminase-like putative cysteine protease [Winslowiella toletana]
MRLNIEHKTAYTYESLVKSSTQYLRLTPQDSVHQHIISWQLILPEDAIRTTDTYGNVLHVLTMDKPHQLLEIEARGVVEIYDEVEMAPDPECLLSPLIFLRFSPLTQPDAAIRDFAQRYWRAEAPLESLETLMAELLLKMPYQPGSTTVTDNAAKVFAAGTGVCQDHSHVFLACCRSLSIPARYVSGYLYTDNVEHVATHAWVEVWLDGSWHSFDITNNTRSLRQHLKLAVGVDYLDACPVRGMRLGGGGEDMLAMAAVQKAHPQ